MRSSSSAIIGTGLDSQQHKTAASTLRALLVLNQLLLSIRHHVAHQLHLFSSFCSFCSLGISVAASNLLVPAHNSRHHHNCGMRAFAGAVVVMLLG